MYIGIQDSDEEDYMGEEEEEDDDEDNEDEEQEEEEGTFLRNFYIIFIAYFYLEFKKLIV